MFCIHFRDVGLAATEYDDDDDNDGDDDAVIDKHARMNCKTSISFINLTLTFIIMVICSSWVVMLYVSCV